MASPFPCRTSLYRKRLAAVTFSAVSATIAAAILLCAPTDLQAQELTQHWSRKDADKGPRALGLVQLSDKGKARIIPIAIMMNGKFFDADSFKADPVPMALDFGVVYEAFRSGVSQGLFTITQPGQLNHEWVAEGTWLPAGAIPKTDKRKYEPPIIDEGGKDDDRPVLHRRPGSEADKDDAKPSSGSPAPSSSPSTSPSSPSAPPSSGTPSPASKDSDKSAANKPPDAGAAKPSDASAPKPAESRASRTSDYDQPINDPNRPILRRGKPGPNAHHEPFVNFDDPDQLAAASKEAGKEADVAKAAAASVQTMAAISDAAGPDPRPYTYDLKPAEEAIYRNKMLELAGEQMRPKAAESSPAKGAKSAARTASARRKTSSSKTEMPDLENVSLRIFDLSNSNEPVLVLSARTPVPPATAPGAQVPQEITLIARTNLEGELQKLYFAQTDSRHLDLRPRMELIDAVDADGDGRGELLFRRTFDSSSAYAIYRVTADGLWPLWEPTP
jgi:hypothetical protein